MKALLKTKNTTRLLEPTAAQLAESLIISVGEARKILGNDANGISDNCLTKLILDILKHKQNTL